MAKSNGLLIQANIILVKEIKKELPDLFSFSEDSDNDLVLEYTHLSGLLLQDFQLVALFGIVRAHQKHFFITEKQITII